MVIVAVAEAGRRLLAMGRDLRRKMIIGYH